MIVITDIGGSLRIFGLRFQFGCIGNVSFANHTDSGVNRRRPGDGFSLAHALERLEGVDLRSFEDGGQVLLLGLQDQFGLGAGLGVDR